MKCCLLHTCIHTFVQEFGWNGSLYGIVSELINNSNKMDNVFFTFFFGFRTVPGES